MSGLRALGPPRRPPRGLVRVAALVPVTAACRVDLRARLLPAGVLLP